MTNHGKIKKTIFFVILSFFVVLLSGCVSGEVKFNEDGSGTAVLTIAKEENMTRQEMDIRIEKVLKGITTQSAESGRVSIKSIKEDINSFVVQLSFKRISGVKGVGYYRYASGQEVATQRTERALFHNFAQGKFSLKGSNYNNSTYSIYDDIENAIQPIKADTKEVLDSESFMNEKNDYYSEKNTIFVFMACGLPHVQEITFHFKGKILVVSDKNVKQIDDHTIQVTPLSVQVDHIGILEDNTTAYTEKNIPASAFMGYVIFEKQNNYAIPILLGVAGVLLIGGIIAGCATGFFKKVIKTKKFRLIIKNRILYLFILPGFLLMLLFNYLPMGGIIVAFKNYTVDGGIFGSEWVGFEHFFVLFTHPGSEFWLILRNTLVMAVFKFICGFPAAIVLALMFNALKNNIFKKSVQTISYLPYFVSWVVVSNLCYILLSANGGIINNILTALGKDVIKFYSEPQYWWGILTVSSIWKTIGWGTIIYLAAITSINSDLYEAASIDGAGTWRKLWTVTLPGMMPIISIQLILSVGSLIKDDFDQIFTMVGGNNYILRSVTEVFSSLVYRQLQGGVSGFSSATAVSLIQSLISLLLVIITNKIISKTDNQGLW